MPSCNLGEDCMKINPRCCLSQRDMAVRCLRLLSVSRLIIQNVRTSSSKGNSQLEAGSRTLSAAKGNASKQPLITRDDSDVFGTLRPEKLQAVDSLFENDSALDKGDVEEDKYLKYRPAYRKNIEKYEEEVKKLVKCNQLKEAMKILEIQMKEDQVKPSRNMYSILLGGCGKVGYTKKAFKLFNDMKKRGMQPTDSHYTALFNACANSPWHEDGLQRAKKLRQQLMEKQYQLNKLQYHAMIKAFGRCGDITTAFEILDEMSSKRVIITTETLNFLLQACISLPGDGFKYAVMVWRKLRLAKVTPDVFSYNLMLRVARDCGISDIKSFQQDCLTLLSANRSQTLTIASSQNLSEESRLGEASLSMNKIDISSCLTMPAQLRDGAGLPNLLSERVQTSNLVEIRHLERPEDRFALMGGIQGLLSEMRNDHAKPDIKTLTLMLETVSSNLQDEMLLLQEMEKLDVQPDVDFVNLLIKKRHLRRDHVSAKNGLDLLQKYNLFPNIMTFGVLALGCRNLDQCVSFCRTLEDAGLRMNKEIFGSLLKNAVYHKDCWYVMHLTHYAKENDLPLDEKAVKLLSDFRVRTFEQIAKLDHGEKVNPIYGDPKFRRSFGEFCKSFKQTLKQLTVELEPHPWTQFRYERNVSEPSN